MVVSKTNKVQGAERPVPFLSLCLAMLLVENPGEVLNLAAFVLKAVPNLAGQFGDPLALLGPRMTRKDRDDRDNGKGPTRFPGWVPGSSSTSGRHRGQHAATPVRSSARRYSQDRSVASLIESFGSQMTFQDPLSQGYY